MVERIDRDLVELSYRLRGVGGVSIDGERGGDGIWKRRRGNEGRSFRPTTRERRINIVANLMMSAMEVNSLPWDDR